MDEYLILQYAYIVQYTMQSFNNYHNIFETIIIPFKFQQSLLFMKKQTIQCNTVSLLVATYDKSSQANIEESKIVNYAIIYYTNVLNGGRGEFTKKNRRYF